MFNFRKESKKAQPVMFTQGQDKSFTYEVGNFYIMKYNFQDGLHANMKILPVVMADGKAYINEGEPIAQYTYDFTNMRGATTKTMLKVMRDTASRISAGFTGHSQYFKNGNRKLAEFMHVGTTIVANISNNREIWDKSDMEASGFHQVDTAHA